MRTRKTTGKGGSLISSYPVNPSLQDLSLRTLAGGASAPGEGVVEDEQVGARVSGFELALDGLPVRVAAGQGDEHLGEEKENIPINL